MLKTISDFISGIAMVKKIIVISFFSYIVAATVFIYVTGHIDREKSLQNYHANAEKFLDFVVDYVRNNPHYYAVQTDYFTKYPGLIGLKIQSNGERTIYVADKSIDRSIYQYLDRDWAKGTSGHVHDDELYHVHVKAEVTGLSETLVVLGVFDKADIIGSIRQRMILEVVVSSIVGMAFIMVMYNMMKAYLNRFQILKDSLESAMSGEKLIDKLPGVADEASILASSFDRIFFQVRDNELAARKQYKNLEQEIVKRKELQDENNALQRQLFHAQKMESIGQLAGGIAHDFNNILSSIIGYSKLLRSSISESGQNIDIDRTLDYLDEVVKAGDRAKNLISNMLSFSRGDKAGPRVKQEVDPESVVNEALSMLKTVLPSSLQLQVNRHGQLPKIDVDPLALHQVLMNLLINARDAMDAQGSIDINLYSQSEPFSCASCHQHIIGTYIIFEVKDRGPGIPTENLDSIFEPFYSTKEVGKGTGMGLSIVHGIMHDMKGHISIESSPGIGTTFRLHFPIVVHEIQIADEGVSDPDTHNVVMLIDDDVPVAKFLTHILEDKEFQVDTFNDPTVALRAFEANQARYSVIVTDNMMPGITGEQLVTNIRKFNKTTPVLMCTGYRGQLSSEFINSDNVQQLFDKPIDVDKLLEAVARCANF